MVTTMSKLLHVSRKTLHNHTKFRAQINENDEVACWDLITKKLYQYRLPTEIRSTVVEFSDSHSHAILD